MAITVLIADDHFIVRSGLVASLGLEPDITVVAEADAAAPVVDLYRKHAPAVVLMDVRLGPGADGITATADLCAAFPDARVLMFSTHGRDEDVFRAVKAGARGYLLKTAPRDELLRAIRTVAAGERYLPQSLADRLAERLSQPELSPREKEILHLVRRGRSNKEIGTALFIAEDTVKRHVSNVLAKLGVADRAEAVAVALRRGLLPEE
ncbi:family transcriptional regulator : Response regulator containing a CheY-like receiver domain and an HTH DNA-binding domain OS=Singulisphaera acidiphila (strain ATCC BAA-1392 / DSM 18658 / VKM B-2454 / MOB10) GN=Sinac_0434 PE=4 SV=1: Response_reg: GerE [Gemmataceae bacterium]|nr:family transcriptional regulator : Response regulator containing a CheY-like receiver domain and an HTH DNA-binding domain OS=Singulisphaera acidiphila (strain ATCC BAA-1392 / DSM 18658 / VKM B-2454 / MOB10) GN=Sinac_0434 PE=4 SV=1: Response_reg: GerE [Gemmataceae bacterium]VTT97100.1 family transcriptional regulator : Response regulator containing a CheY-like receiver domain and an HTH DNA-binding domain OS=Singulisphaera acidiphila (strain ATCC BAA-1392 / DSM 18658 / VKM B-2454 / MOB10) GN=Si